MGGEKIPGGFLFLPTYPTAEFDDFVIMADAAALVKSSLPDVDTHILDYIQGEDAKSEYFPLLFGLPMWRWQIFLVR